MFVTDGGTPVSGDVQITSLPVGPADGEVTILPFPMPGDDDVFTILPFPMPGDDGVFTILPVFDENVFAVHPLTVDFDFSSLTIGTISLSALDWNSLLPGELVSADGFGFQSFVLNGDGGMTLTLLDGSFVTLAPADLSAISFPAVEDAGRLAVDPSTLTGVLLDGFNAGWI
ncbi:MAG: hypothetical protein ACOVN0_12940 [Niveispirillum sp.]|uniref:hypothetical protein n=1 Tax=Niveispirillum sp. TaxID=1917217 RepID=UPI003BA540C5